MNESFYISTDMARLQIDVIYGFLSQQAYWAKGRSIDTMSRSVKNSLCFGVYTKDHQQVGFARVVSDFAVFAWVLDVFILDSHRGKGLSKLLMKEIMQHPDLQGLQRWGLATVDAHGLYQQFGFKPLARPELFMEVTGKPH